MRAPASKSYTIRALMCAAMASGDSEIRYPLDSDDTRAAREVLGGIGVRLLQREDSWRVSGGRFHEPAADLFCRESAATLRFMTAICSIVPGQCRLTSAPSLAMRPIEPLLQALRQLGVDCQQNEDKTVIVRGGRLNGTAELPGNISSQFVSALLLVSPRADDRVSIRLTTPPESRPYVLMTLECLKEFGIEVNAAEGLREFEIQRQEYRPVRYTVEGDWSSASYLLALGALCGEVEVEDLNPESLQADRAILDLLRDMGARITVGRNSISASRSTLRAIRADLSDCIDLLPTMAALAAAADGVSDFTGVERARLKESNRVASVREGLERMGTKVVEERNRLTVVGGAAKGAVIDSHGDHRIAMAFSLLGSATGGTVIDGAECVAKTYPGFWETLKSLGGKVVTDGE